MDPRLRGGDGLSRVSVIPVEPTLATPVIPADAGIQGDRLRAWLTRWTPAFAGVTGFPRCRRSHGQLILALLAQTSLVIVNACI